MPRAYETFGATPAAMRRAAVRWRTTLSAGIEDRMPARQAVATIVASDAVTKLEALDVLSRITGSPVEGARTPMPRVSLGHGAWAQVDIPKFGEPPPLAIDVYADGDESDAQRHALALAVKLRSEAGWSVLPAFAVA